MPDAGGNDFRADVMDGENIRNRFDEMDSLFTDVIQATHERTDKNRARPGGHQSLVGGKNQRHIRGDIVFRQYANSLEPFQRHRHLDHDIFRQCRQLFAFGDHFRRGGPNHLGADRAVDDPANFPDHRLDILFLFGDKGRVRGHAIKQAPLGDFPDFLQIGCVQKKPHVTSPLLIFLHGRKQDY